MGVHVLFKPSRTFQKYFINVGLVSSLISLSRDIVGLYANANHNPPNGGKLTNGVSWYPSVVLLRE